MSFCKSDQKSMPMVGFLTRNDSDILRAKTGPYRHVGYQTNIPPTTCWHHTGPTTSKSTWKKVQNCSTDPSTPSHLQSYLHSENFWRKMSRTVSSTPASC